MPRFIVSLDQKGQRLDRVLAAITTKTRSHIKMLIEHSCVRVAGQVQKAGYLLHKGEEIEILPLPEPPASAVPQIIPLEILYEDKFLAAINKPPGMVVHPGPGQWERTVVNGLLGRWNWESAASSLRPGIVHRLDKDTSGVLVVAKDSTTQERLSLQFKERRVHKGYVAVVLGHLKPSSGRIALPIGRHPSDRKKMSVRARRSRSALSRYEVLEEKKGVSLILLYPETGRTHQLRVHLAAIGHPIVGDPVYGKQQLPPALPEIARTFRRQALHAAAIAFRHPMTEELLMIHAPYAADYAKLLDALQFVTTERQIRQALTLDN